MTKISDHNEQQPYVRYHLTTSNLCHDSSQISEPAKVKRALHYPFNLIRFLEIKKLCNVIAENLTISTNRKLISIS